MIDAATAILIPALPLGIAAGLGWMRCARMLADLQTQFDRSIANFSQGAKIFNELHDLHLETLQRGDTWKRLAIDLQERLDVKAAKRSSITSRGNITRAAKRKALQNAKTEELREQLKASIKLEMAA